MIVECGSYDQTLAFTLLYRFQFTFSGGAVGWTLLIREPEILLNGRAVI